MGLVIRKWVWLDCIYVVSGGCCKEVQYIDFLITYPYSTCISSFFGSCNPYFFVHFKNVFLFFITCKQNICIQ